MLHGFFACSPLFFFFGDFSPCAFFSSAVGISRVRSFAPALGPSSSTVFLSLARTSLTDGSDCTVMSSFRFITTVGSRALLIWHGLSIGSDFKLGSTICRLSTPSRVSSSLLTAVSVDFWVGCICVDLEVCVLSSPKMAAFSSILAVEAFFSLATVAADISFFFFRLLILFADAFDSVFSAELVPSGVLFLAAFDFEHPTTARRRPTGGSHSTDHIASWNGPLPTCRRQIVSDTTTRVLAGRDAIGTRPGRQQQRTTEKELPPLSFCLNPSVFLSICRPGSSPPS